MTGFSQVVHFIFTWYKMTTTEDFPHKNDNLTAFFNSRALQVCLEKDDFGQIDTVIVNHGLTFSTVRTILGIRLELAKVESEERRNTRLLMLAIFGILAGISQLAGYIVNAAGTGKTAAQVCYGIAIAFCILQMACGYSSYQVSAEERSRLPMRKLYFHLKNENIPAINDSRRTSLPFS